MDADVPNSSPSQQAGCDLALPPLLVITPPAFRVPAVLSPVKQSITSWGSAPAVPLAWISLPLDFPIPSPSGLLWPGGLNGTLFLFSLGPWWFTASWYTLLACFLLSPLLDFDSGICVYLVYYCVLGLWCSAGPLEQKEKSWSSLPLLLPGAPQSSSSSAVPHMSFISGAVGSSC